MKKTRDSVFETNSSSTHSLICTRKMDDYEYLPESDKVIVDFIDTNDEYRLMTLREKVSYLVSHIVNHYKYDVEDYDDLKEQVECSYDFERIVNYVREHFGKEVVLPKKYDYDIDEIVGINHQLICRDLDELLEDMIEYDHDFLDDVLAPDKTIEIGHD